MNSTTEPRSDVEERVALGNSKLTKARPCLIKFKSMAEILMEGPCWFDGHGNLCKNDVWGKREHLAPSYFSYLGQMRKFENQTSFPHWCISAEYADIFEPNMALRCIASGRYSKEEQEQIAQNAVIVP